MKIYKPNFENIELMKKYLSHNKYKGCELSLANLCLWADYYETYFAIVEDMIVFCKLKEDKPYKFSFPIGENNQKAAFDKILEYFDENQLPVYFYVVEKEMFEQIEKWYPKTFSIEYDRDEADYLYERKTLENLAGKKLHGKRNHINRFLENYPDYVYEKIDDSNKDECIKLAVDWLKNNNPDIPEDEDYELRIIKVALDNMELLNLQGAVLKVDGRVIAFTVGEPLSDKVYDVHFEKAYADIQGAYAMINREFVRNELGAFKYINREEDLGIPGLRHAKTSYQPICLVEKGNVKKL